jgi:glycosyltransferase involved in cell wall biosynthesis
MKVAVNIHCLHPPLTGIGHYARHLLSALLEDPRLDAVAGVSHRGWHSQQEVQSICAHAGGYEPVAGGAALSLGRRALRRIPGVGRLRARFNYALQQRQSRQYRDHIYWEPNYLLLPLANRALTTVHDLSHVRHPEFHPQERLRELAQLPRSLQQAERVVTVSEFTRTELADVFGLNPAEIPVISPAASRRFRPHSPQECQLIRQRYKLPAAYILFAGTLEPRKNLPLLLQAYSALPRQLQQQYPLVLVGGDGWHPQEFEATMSRLKNNNILRLGYVNYEDLPALFSAATIFAYPSLYEGFGMPVLEAMASGTPVLTSNVASMPEVAAGAAVLVDPRCGEELTQQLQLLLEDELQREDMSRRGLVNAQARSWEASYTELYAALQGVDR